jgi:hypothetical protein
VKAEHPLDTFEIIPKGDEWRVKCTSWYVIIATYS